MHILTLFCRRRYFYVSVYLILCNFWCILTLKTALPLPNIFEPPLCFCFVTTLPQPKGKKNWGIPNQQKFLDHVSQTCKNFWILYYPLAALHLTYMTYNSFIYKYCNEVTYGVCYVFKIHVSGTKIGIIMFAEMYPGV